MVARSSLGIEIALQLCWAMFAQSLRRLLSLKRKSWPSMEAKKRCRMSIQREPNSPMAKLEVTG